MAANHLEQLVAEWHEYKGYFVRRNVNVGLRKEGGYECELDIVAFNPETKHLIQIEPSLDSDSWVKRELRFKKKFEAGKQYIPKLFTGIQLPGNIEQIALLLYASKKNHEKIGGGKVKLVSDLIVEIVDYLRDKRIAKNAVSEQFSLIRTMQFVIEYKKDIFGL